MGDLTSVVLAFGARHGPPDPAGGLIMACFCGMWSALMVAAAVSPSLRSGFRWGRGRSGAVPMSRIGCLGCAVAAAACSVAMIGESTSYATGTARTGWILGGSFVLLIATALWDSRCERRRARGSVKPSSPIASTDPGRSAAG